jgi:hypothetical protein
MENSGFKFGSEVVLDDRRYTNVEESQNAMEKKERNQRIACPVPAESDRSS